jgi:hypothetical protein
MDKLLLRESRQMIKEIKKMFAGYHKYRLEVQEQANIEQLTPINQAEREENMETNLIDVPTPPTQAESVLKR